MLKRGDDAGQGVTRLRMGGGDNQLAVITIRVLAGEFFDVVGAKQYPLRQDQQLSTRLGEHHQSFAFTLKQLQPARLPNL